ncbi:MAG: alkaline phosphatase family protein [Pyrinomonadaceae bacterium]
MNTCSVNARAKSTAPPAQRRIALRIVLTIIVLLVFQQQCLSQTRRLVVVKCDGLPYDVVDRFVMQRDPRTGKSALPWFDYIFYQHGSRLANFYVRGMSLSAPSWSLLDTGQHLQIKGNVEFDRYTLHTYDYLNFFPLYLNGVIGARIDMPAVEVLDSLGVPLLVDAYPHNEHYATFSLLQRGTRYRTLQYGLQNRFKKSPKDLFDEWTMGFGMRDAMKEQLLRETIQKLQDPKIRYLDFFMPDFDHIAHHNNDAQSQLFVLKEMDAVLGQLWTAIQQTPLADQTALVLVSDHGFNSDARVYSQGYNLVKLLGSAEGGGHHIITKRRLLLDYSIKGVYPLVPLITTTTAESYYLKGQSTDYPTALLDFDGNERASIHLRDSDLNLLHILLQQLQNGGLSTEIRKGVTKLFFETIDRRRIGWERELEFLKVELGALHRSIEKQRALWLAQPKKFTKEQQDAGEDDASKRVFVQLDRWSRQEKEYGEYAATLGNLLALSPATLESPLLKIDSVIKKQSMGDSNRIYELQNYIVGIGPSGLVLGPDGNIDLQKSFIRINYFDLLHGVVVRNNVQPGVSNQPIDLTAVRLSTALIAPLLHDENLSADVLWIDAGAGEQALILSRVDSRCQLSLRYQPIRNLTQDAEGKVHFDIVDWHAGLPLHIFEDPKLAIPENERRRWLSDWHTDLEWLHALHNTRYSNGLIGLHEELARHLPDKLSTSDRSLTDDERLMRELAWRERELIEPDMLLVANDHWNFDVRGFNPGGNHGSFFRISTHSTFMIAGGVKTNIPVAYIVDEPYDSLSFIPTLLALTGNLRDDSNPVPALWEKGFRRFPGRIVKELLLGRVEAVAGNGANSSP